jgi:hypothetical protein
LIFPFDDIRNVMPPLTWWPKSGIIFWWFKPEGLRRPLLSSRWLYLGKPVSPFLFTCCLLLFLIPILLPLFPGGWGGIMWSFLLYNNQTFQNMPDLFWTFKMFCSYHFIYG